MKYLLFLLLPVFAACNHNPSVPSVEKVDVVKRIQVPSELLQSCPEILSSYPAKIQDILLEDLDILQMYGECRLRHKKLIGAVQGVVK